MTAKRTLVVATFWKLWVRNSYIRASADPRSEQERSKAFYAAADLDYYKAFEFMNEAFARLCSTDDAKEGVAAFFEKRNPEWKLR